MSPGTFLNILLIDLRLYLRNWTASFWTFLFPILLLVLLMTAFGGGARLGEVTLDVRDGDRSPQSADYVRSLTAVFDRIDAIQFKTTFTPAESGEHVIIMTIPRGFGQDVSRRQPATVDIIVPGTPTATTRVALSILSSVNDRINITSGRSRELVELKVQTGARSTDEIAYGQYLVAGIVGMVVFSTCLFGFTLPIVGYRQSGYLKILELLPVPKAWFFASFVTARLCIVICYIALFLAFARIVYGITIPAEPATLGRFVFLLALGAGTFLSIGLLISAIAPSSGGALALCNLLYFCTVFASDLFIPIKNFPAFMSTITSGFPLQPLVSSFRAVLFSGAPLSEQRGALIVLCAWTVLCLAAVIVLGQPRKSLMLPSRLISGGKS